ncbi:MAG: DUF2288 domain-containing protein [Byssovorax sp.]
MRDRLRAMVGVVLWSDLQAHAKRDAVIVVAAGLDLVDAGAALAENDAARVEQWIQAGLLNKPTAEDLERWSIDRAARFDSLIVAPFVLIRARERPASESN